MAVIRNFQEEREKREKGQADYHQKIRHYRLSHVYRILLVAAALIALIALVVVQYKNHIYTSYEVINTTEVEVINGTVNMPLGSHTAMTVPTVQTSREMFCGTRHIRCRI